MKQNKSSIHHLGTIFSFVKNHSVTGFPQFLKLKVVLKFEAENIH